MVQRAGVAQRYAQQIALGGFRRLADGFRHFARLAMTETDAAFQIADDDQRGKAEPFAALDDLGDAIDVHQLVGELAVAFFAVSATRSLWGPRATMCVLSVS